MRQRENGAPLFAVCVDNSGYPASLELHKIYRVLPDKKAAADDMLCVIDESGEDYLFSARRFILMELPTAVRRALLQSSNGEKRQEDIVIKNKQLESKLTRNVLD